MARGFQCEMILQVLVVFCLYIHCYSKYLYRTEYINVPVDHFSFSDNRTFSLRYLINDSYWKPVKGPIFFYTGNEGNIEMFAQNTGFLWETAIKFRALIIFAEHRYYGRSLPFGNLSLTEPKYFGYLTSEQALADFVDLIYLLRARNKKNHLRKVNPVIAFGGSYGGMLSAWMRMKYPSIIEGALASSAPIWQFTGMTSCDAFSVITTKVFSYSSQTCVQNIRKSWKIIENFAAKENGKRWMNKNWKLCDPINTKADLDALTEWVSYVYNMVAMINYPYPTNFLMPVPGNPVNEMCKSLNSSSLSGKNLLKAVFKSVSTYFNYSGTTKCLKWSSDPSPDLGLDGWNIQACTEMVMPFCSNGKTDMFKPSKWNLKENAEYCFKTYKVYPDQYKIEKTYGGKDIHTTSNIIFSNGELDPWISGGVTKSVSPTAIAVVIPKSAHHLDLRSPHKNDPVNVVKARKLYTTIFRRWIRKYYERHVIFDATKED